MNIYNLFISFLTFNSVYMFQPFISSNKKEVILHLEKFNQKYNLLHIGISFRNYDRNLRYDFRAFNEDRTCITTDINRRDIRLLFPDLNLPETYDDSFYKEYTDCIESDLNNKYSKDILWGVTNKTFDEIIDFEKTINKKYKLGIYDCRHYVNHFTNWCLDAPSPIWKLHKLWDTY